MGRDINLFFWYWLILCYNYSGISFVESFSRYGGRNWQSFRSDVSKSLMLKSSSETAGEKAGSEGVSNKRGTPGGIRGGAYGEMNNSTIPTPMEVAASVGVAPTLENASQKTWQRAWRLHKAVLPLLHRFDSCRPPNSSLNLACLWWKAISGNDPNSPVCDNGLSNDLLPRGSRFIVRRPLQRFYPRLHHANVEIRTAYLDRAVTNAIKKVKENDEQRCHTNPESIKIRLICLGAGYDLRSIKFMERKLIDEAIEIDLESTIEAKKKLLGPRRLLRRRPWLKDLNMPIMIAGDLNEVSNIKSILNQILLNENNSKSNDHNIHESKTTETKPSKTIHKWHNIFVFEAVMIYLNDGVPSSLLKMTSDVLRNNGFTSGSLCFADRLENVPGGDESYGVIEMKSNGWHLQEWCPKPGLARHMGAAELVSTNQ